MTGGLDSYVILQALQPAITTWATGLKGTVNVAHNPAAGLELLMSQAPQGWRVIIGIDNEDSPEGFPALSGVSNTEFFTQIQTGLGLPITPGDEIARQRAAGSASIMEIAAAVRCFMRGLIFEHQAIDCQIGFSWSKSSWISLHEDGQPLRYAREHRFILQHLIARPMVVAPVTIPA